MFVLFNEAYNRLLSALPPEIRRALLFGLGAFFILAAIFGTGSGLAMKLAS